MIFLFLIVSSCRFDFVAPSTFFEGENVWSVFGWTWFFRNMRVNFGFALFLGLGFFIQYFHQGKLRKSTGILNWWEIFFFCHLKLKGFPTLPTGLQLEWHSWTILKLYMSIIETLKFRRKFEKTTRFGMAKLIFPGLLFSIWI